MSSPGSSEHTRALSLRAASFGLWCLGAEIKPFLPKLLSVSVLWQHQRPNCLHKLHWRTGKSKTSTHCFQVASCLGHTSPEEVIRTILGLVTTCIRGDYGWLSKKKWSEYRLPMPWHQELSHLSSAISTNVIQNWQRNNARETTLYFYSLTVSYEYIMNFCHFHSLTDTHSPVRTETTSSPALKTFWEWMWVYSCVHVHINTRVHGCMHYVCVCVYVCKDVCVCVNLCVCMCTPEFSDMLTWSWVRCYLLELFKFVLFMLLKKITSERKRRERCWAGCGCSQAQPRARCTVRRRRHLIFALLFLLA